MPVVTVDTARISYRVVGEGPETLVLVHGTGPGSGMWDHLLASFTDRYTVLLPDLSGSETAEDDGARLTVETLAAQVNAVIEDAGRGPVHLVGFSSARSSPPPPRPAAPSRSAGWSPPRGGSTRRTSTCAT